MSASLPESLARVLGARASGVGLGDPERVVAVLRETLDVYGPSNLCELYIAVRAKACADGEDWPSLREVLRRVSREEPEVSLESFARERLAELG